MIFRAIAITTVIAGIVFTEGAIIYFYDNKTKSQKGPAKVQSQGTTKKSKK